MILLFNFCFPFNYINNPWNILLEKDLWIKTGLNLILNYLYTKFYLK